MITNFFIPELNNDVQELWFQQDGATCPTARATIDLLKDTFGDRLMSRFGPVNWPPRSCDLTPLDYFLWGYVNSWVYVDKPQTPDHLEDRIRRLRVLLQNPHNQDLITHLGTRYEIVNPVQIRQEWGRRLSTRVTNVNGTATHLQQTSLFIETFEYKLYLDLELNTNLFPSTLVQFIYEKGGPPIALQELPENCYYHATVRNYPDASAAFYTCNGMRGIIFLENKVFLLHPLQGNHSDNYPHLLYHFTPDQLLNCANTDAVKSPLQNILQSRPEEKVLQRNKFIEIAVVIDQTLFEKYDLPERDVIASTIEAVNYADLHAMQKTGFQMLNNDKIVTSVQEQSEHVDDEIDEDEEQQQGK
ncbi:uncharacterized protein TNCV_1126701 [Trichonephila clavipes]|nr:uncharacterized protein TNCV_1126701 [Trichonephila clavipes]